MDTRRPASMALVVGLVLVTLFVLLPTGAVTDVLFLAGAVSAVVAVGAGVHLHRPSRPLPWQLLQAGLSLNAVGEVVFVGYLHVLHRPPFPGPASWLYVAAYAFVALAMVSMGRAGGHSSRRWRGRGELLDAATITVAVGLPMWLFLVRPAVSGADVGLSARLTVAGYSLGAVVVAAQLLGLLTARAQPVPSLRVLASAGATGLVSTLTFHVLTLLDQHPYGWVNPGLLLAFTLTSMAALHPSMPVLSDPHPRLCPGARAWPGSGGGLELGMDHRLAPVLVGEGVADAPSRWRVVLLGGALLVVPVSLAVGLVRHRALDAADGWVVLLGGAAVSLLVLGRMAGLLRQVHAQAAQLAALARTDPLTGVLNRRGFDDAAGDAVARYHSGTGSAVGASDPGAGPALVLLDLDHFKAVNDTLGHPAGDAVLRSAVEAWQRRLRTGDVLARIGGEEFAALLPATSLEAAVRVAEDLRGVMPSGVTVSAGVASWCGDELTAWLQRADQALYQAKNAGRDQVVSG